ncbi:MAG: DUF885 domain-containing protein [Bacteroidia bacterium]|nr:DUF885 domain-containing protein [Bacteroidia bacterium]
MKTFILSIVVFSFFLGCAHPQEHAKAINLKTLLEQYSKDYHKLNPLEATFNGVNDYNDQLAIRIGESYIENMMALNQKYLDSLIFLDRQGLIDSEQISLDLFGLKLTQEMEMLGKKFGHFQQGYFYRPVNHFVWSFPQRFAEIVPNIVPLDYESDYYNFIERMKVFPSWVDQAIANMNVGLELQNTNPKQAMERVLDQLKPIVEEEMDNHPFYKPVLYLPDWLESESKAQLRAEYKAAINDFIKPAYKKLYDYLVSEYIPNAQESAGLINNKNGIEEYQFWLRFFTNTDLTGDSIFEIGKNEVQRIRHEMDSLKTAVSFRGDLKDFFHHIRTDPKFFPFTTEQEILDRYRSFQNAMDTKLKEMFNLTPQAGFKIESRASAADAEYYGPQDENGYGIFYVSVGDPKEYNCFKMESLFLHEAIPGHHFQVALQIEADIPKFRKSYYDGAYQEGWGLYAESLGTELGLYKDPYQYMGRLTKEMERAVRLVVDTGIHSKGWSRERAIQYVLDNQPITESEAELQVDRYIVIPGQAVSYKIGELKILELRTRAEKQLGDRFDIKDFHDQILKDGVLPLNILEERINQWIQEKGS